MKVIILHGYGSSKNDHWFPWLKSELESRGYEVWCESLPNTDAPDPEEWTSVILAQLKEDAIVIGHSLGIPAGLNALRRFDGTIRAFFSVAGFAQPLELDFAEKINSFVLEHSEPEPGLKPRLEILQNNCKNFHILDSTNDPYVPISCGDFLTDGLAALRYTFQNRNHLGTWDYSGGKFEELLSLILESGPEI
jgi:predicted alpha/beta hydrolase family esterase